MIMKQNKLSKRLYFQNPNIAQKIYNLIAEIEKYKGMWIAGVKLSPQILNVLKKSTIITSTGSSTRIEGSKLNDEEIENLFLPRLKIKKFSTRDEQEVAGYKELLENVFNSYQNIIFNENAIKHFHKELLKYSEKDKRHSGTYKFSDNKVIAKNSNGKILGIIFEPTLPYLTPKEMQELVDWTKQEFKANNFHPLLIIGNFILEFLAIHPFADGNGRTSRVLTNLLMLKNGYEYMPYVSHEKFIEDNKEKYYLALNKSQRTLKTEKPDITLWMLFFLEIILAQAKLAIEISQSERIELFLSANQMKVWEYILEKKEITPKEIRENLKIPTSTVLQILNKLIKMKKIERIGEGRSVKYKIIK